MTKHLRSESSLLWSWQKNVQAETRFRFMGERSRIQRSSSLLLPGVSPPFAGKFIILVPVYFWVLEQRVQSLERVIVAFSGDKTPLIMVPNSCAAAIRLSPQHLALYYYIELWVVGLVYVYHGRPWASMQGPFAGVSDLADEPGTTWKSTEDFQRRCSTTLMSLFVEILRTFKYWQAWSIKIAVEAVAG